MGKINERLPKKHPIDTQLSVREQRPRFGRQRASRDHNRERERGLPVVRSTYTSTVYYWERFVFCQTETKRKEHPPAFVTRERRLRELFQMSAASLSALASRGAGVASPLVSGRSRTVVVARRRGGPVVCRAQRGGVSVRVVLLTTTYISHHRRKYSRQSYPNNHTNAIYPLPPPHASLPPHPRPLFTTTRTHHTHSP